MYVALFARRVAFSRVSVSVMLWSHARLLFGARFLFFYASSVCSLSGFSLVCLSPCFSFSVSFVLLVLAGFLFLVALSWPFGG